MAFFVSACGSDISEDRVKTGNIVFLGDSITEGYEVSEKDRYTTLIQQYLEREGYDYTVINQGISGDKTEDGLERLEAVLEAEPEVVVVALGGNDFLKRVTISKSQKNLTDIIQAIQEKNADVMLVGVTAPPTRGLGYVGEAKKMYKHLAKENDLVLMPNILKGIMLDQRYMQSDNIHPNEAGHKVIAENMWEDLVPLLRK